MLFRSMHVLLGTVQSARGPDLCQSCCSRLGGPHPRAATFGTRWLALPRGQLHRSRHNLNWTLAVIVWVSVSRHLSACQQSMRSLTSAAVFSLPKPRTTVRRHPNDHAAVCLLTGSILPPGDDDSAKEYVTKAPQGMVSHGTEMGSSFKVGCRFGAAMLV